MARATHTELRSARELSGMTQEDMANRLNMTVQSVIRFERNPSKMTLAQFATWYQGCNSSGQMLLDKYVADIIKAS